MMLKQFFFLLIFCIPSVLIAQDPLTPHTTVAFHKLGNNYIRIETSQYGDNRQPVFINLHDDEVTAVMGAKKLLETKGGLLIRLDNNGQRNIRFRLDGRNYTFDPNRIFSRKGIIQTLDLYGRWTEHAVAEITKFATRLLQIIPENPSTIVALHNNTDGKFSITSFLPGRPRANDARKVYMAPGQDEDDIFLTTDSSLYQNLVNENYNVVWQDNKKATRDGSLSIYCGEKNICYLNCETEHDKLSQYQQMIMAAGNYIYPRKVSDTVLR